MDEEIKNNEIGDKENRDLVVSYHQDKDFYRGMSGELRFKAEGLFKKAKEKGISIEEVEINFIRENKTDFPGIGTIDLPTIIVKVKGRNIHSGQTIIDAKQMDYFNRYQMYLSEKIEAKNQIKDEKGKVVKENNKPKIKSGYELSISDWEKFEIGKNLIEDKEFGLEKTITGGCDRIIRKLMGENDWLNQGEARLLDEEFETVQKRIISSSEYKKNAANVVTKKATERQINYLKSRIKNMGADPEDKKLIEDVIKQAGFGVVDINELNTGEISKIIDNISALLTQIKGSTLSKNDSGIIYTS